MAGVIGTIKEIFDQVSANISTSFSLQARKASAVRRLADPSGLP